MIFLIYIITLVATLEFEYWLEPHESVCFFDTLPKNTLIVGDIYGYPESFVTVFITDPNRNLITHSNTSEPIFQLTTEIDGEYQMCFQNYRTVDSIFKFKYRTGEEALDYQMIAKKKNANEIEMELLRIEKLLSSIQMQMKFNIARENNNLSFTEFISFKILGFGGVLLFTLFFINYMAVQYIKNYLQRKKML